MIRHAITAALVAALFSTAVPAVSQAAPADEVRFPYDATVAADNVYVRSGPGRRYYHTNKLNKGDRVVVRRHDVGGWYMIDPPPNAFSWIRADAVKRVGGNRGVVTVDRIRVHVGSEFDQSHDTHQQTLSMNDTVEILSEETIQEPERSLRMLKIVPPRSEYRWISMKFVVPADASVREHHDRDPYAIPSSAKRLPEPGDSYDGIHDDHDGKHRHDERARRGKAVQDRGPGIDVMAAEKEQLRRLDEEFRSTVRREARYWNLASLERDYRDLYDAVERPAMKKQVGLRLDAIERYERVKAEYDEFLALTTATNWRDQKLQAIDRRHAGQRGYMPAHNHLPAPMPSHVQSHVPTHGYMPTQSHVPTQMPTHMQPISSPRTGEAPPPRADGIPTMPTLTVPPVSNHHHDTVVNPISHDIQRDTPFDGAGVIQRSTYGGYGTPQHALMSPQGKVLAYLQAEPGVNLDRYVGQSMGVRGKRWHRHEMHADFIMVRKLTPVRLIP